MTIPDISLHFDTDLPLAEYFDVGSAVLPDPAVTPGLVEQAVAEVGETAVLIRCLVAAFDDYDGFAPETSSFDLRLMRVLLSSPSEKEVRTLAGRGIDATKRATLSERIKVQPDREGMGDLLLTVSDAAVLGVTGSGAAWTIMIARPEIPGSATYTVQFGVGSVTLDGLDREEYQVYRVADAKRDKHPFANLTKNTLYLREAVGR